jgi:hypothetical protein
VEKLWKSCGKAVEKLWKSCGKAVEKLWKSCRKAVEKLWQHVLGETIWAFHVCFFGGHFLLPPKNRPLRRFAFSLRANK